MSQSDDDAINTGSAEFKLVKAGCGVRFDPDLNEESGFDFSGSEKLCTEDVNSQTIPSENSAPTTRLSSSKSDD